MSKVTQWVSKPALVDMVRWDGSPEALALIRSYERAPGDMRAEHRADGSLSIYAARARAVVDVRRGDWVAIESYGTGVYPVTTAEHADQYEPATRDGKWHGYSRRLTQLAQLGQDDLIMRFRAAYPHHGLPTTKRGFVSRDGLMTALLEHADARRGAA